MFVQKTKSKRGSSTYVSFLVRQSFRTPDGPRSRTVCNITGLPEPVRDLIAAALRGQSFVGLDQLKLQSALSYGGLAVLVDAWRRLDMDRLLEPIASGRNRGLIQAMIFARLLFPCAKLALAQQAPGTLLAQACGLDPSETFDEDDLCGAMDLLNGQWVNLEKQLHAKAFASEIRVVLYDLTSVYFEGRGPDVLGAYVHSRDHRSDRPQVVLAVATDPQGVPIHLEVLRGNRNDNSTLQSLLAALRRRFSISEAIFVFDGGMSSKFNLEAMDEAQLKYVTRLSASTFKAVVERLPEETQLMLSDRRRILDLTHEGKRYVIAGGKWRRQPDEERRRSRLEKGQAELERLAAIERKKPDAQKLASQVGRALTRLKAHKYFTYRVDAQGRLQWSPNQEVIDQEARIDGWYLLHTNAEPEVLNKNQTLAHYKGLLEIEEAFCQLKSYLEIRPVFHRRPDRVRNHIRICFLAYWLSARLGVEWRGAGEKGEVPRILRELQTIRVGTISVKDKPLSRLITEIPPALNEQLSRLGLLKLVAGPPNWVTP